jgi:hypothetical protein
MLSTEVKELITNIGIRREDLIDLLIVKSQGYAEDLRHQKASGEFKFLIDYPDVKKEMLK